MNARAVKLVVVAASPAAGGLRAASRSASRSGRAASTRPATDLLALASGRERAGRRPERRRSTRSCSTPAATALRVVANFAVGYDNVDLEACRERGVIVTNTPDVLTEATAELALALTLAAARRMSDAERDLRAGRWRGWDPAAYRGIEICGATVGVVGMGRIGHRYARLAHGARRRDRLRGPVGEAGGGDASSAPAGSSWRSCSRLPTSSASTPRRRPRPAGLIGAARARADRPGRGPGQHLAGSAGRLGGRRRGARERDARRRRPRRLRGRARGPAAAARGAALRAAAAHRLGDGAGARRDGARGRRQRDRGAGGPGAAEPGRLAAEAVRLAGRRRVAALRGRGSVPMIASQSGEETPKP